MSDQAPTVFNDRYEMHRHLARGGMSDVYLAKDLLLDRPVAVKVLFTEYARDPAFVERFRREAQAAANLNHPNIVAVYDWGQQSGTYFIVMEYIEGRSLSDIVRTEGPLHPRRAAEIAADVAAALGFAHRNGVVHRDIKPGNILISPSGQVKVADFGIAQAVVGGAEANLTQAGAVMGTATYFSPEQAQGKAVDPRSDLYSLGCVLYEMLTTRPPFSGDTPVAIAYKHVQEPAPLPSSTGVSVPPALEA
jgi:serine/threonine-protein kinase